MTCTCALNTIFCGCGRLVLSGTVEAAVEARKGLVCRECGARIAAETLAERVLARHVRECFTPVQHRVTVSIGGRRVR